MRQGDTIVPIPGARKIRHLEENSAAAAIALAPENLVTIERAMPQEAISGDRYAADALALVNG